MSVKEFPTKQVLELACAAQRINGEYLKESTSVFADDGVFVYSKTPNKILMFVTLDPMAWTADPKQAPMPLKITKEDTELADEILAFYKRLMFAAIEGSNEFLTSINSLLAGDSIKLNQFGYIACLPSVYLRDRMHTNVKRAARKSEEGFLGEAGARLEDLDCEILEVVKSKNFDGYNVYAIIQNKMVSWVSQKELKLGPCVVVKAKIKAQSKHWKHGTDETRLHYVKAAQ